MKYLHNCGLKIFTYSRHIAYLVLKGRQDGLPSKPHEEEDLYEDDMDTC